MSVTAPGQEPLETAAFMATPATVRVRRPDVGADPERARAAAGVLAASGPDAERLPRRSRQATAKTFRVIDGVRYSIPGDYAIIDADGTVHLLGRGSVCINTGGEKVYPEEVEVAARSHPAIVDCVAVGRARRAVGRERRAGGLTPAGQRPSTREAVIAHVQGAARRLQGPAPRGASSTTVYRSPSGKADYRWAHDAAAAGAVTGQ